MTASVRLLGMAGTMVLYARACAARPLSHADRAELLGISLRTSQRWAAGGGSPSVDQLIVLARDTFEVDPALASELAMAAGTTLEALGLVPGPRSFDPAHVVDSVVCVAAEAANVMPGVIRPALLAAIRRARQLHLSLDELERALASSGPVTRDNSPAPGSTSPAP